MAAPLFTVKAGNGFASRIGVEREALAGATVVFTSNIQPGELVSIDGSLERVENVTVTLDGNGRINGYAGTLLLADDPSLGLARPLRWKVSVHAAQSKGFPRPVNPFWFQAGAYGQTVDLAQVPRVPDQMTNGAALPYIYGPGGGGEGGGVRSVTVVVAAADSSPAGKESADYVCDGTDDHVEINAAIASLPTNGGKVVLLEGYFSCPGEIIVDRDAVTLEGQGGYATIIGVPSNTVLNRRAAIVVGSTKKAQHFIGRDLWINVNDFGGEVQQPNPGTGHGIVITGGKYRLERVTVQYPGGDGFHYGQSMLEPPADKRTTVSAASNGVPFETDSDTINVVSTAGFLPAGFLIVRKPGDSLSDRRYAWVSYSGTTETSFTGCKAHWRGDDWTTEETDPWADTFTLSTGDTVYQGEACYDGITYATFADDLERHGYYIDFPMSSCEWVLARAMGSHFGVADLGEGDIGHPTEMGDQHGFYVQGSVLKFTLCHPYMFRGSGMYIGGKHSYTANNITVDGGEYETCATDGISVRNNTGHVSILNANFYGNGINWFGSDIRCAPGSINVSIVGDRFFKGPLEGTGLLGKNIWFSGLNRGEVAGCSFMGGGADNTGHDWIYMTGQHATEAWGQTLRVKVHHNTFWTWNAGGHAVRCDGPVFDCEISDNISDAKFSERENELLEVAPDRNLFRNNTLVMETEQEPTYTLVGPNSRVECEVDPPEGVDSPGWHGQWAYGTVDDTHYEYLCIATDTWRRKELASW